MASMKVGKKPSKTQVNIASTMHELLTADDSGELDIVGGEDTLTNAVISEDALLEHVIIIELNDGESYYKITIEKATEEEFFDATGDTEDDEEG